MWFFFLSVNSHFYVVSKLWKKNLFSLSSHPVFILGASNSISEIRNSDMDRAEIRGKIAVTAGTEEEHRIIIFKVGTHFDITEMKALP